MVELPRFFRVRQRFDAPTIGEPAAEVDRQLSRLALDSKIQQGQTVAITAGSRGIHKIDEIIRAIAQHVTQLGGAPFIVPAMGSHGGGTAEGQRKVIESYGITESFCRCPIRSSMDTVEVCLAEEGFPVHFDKNASQADHVIVCGRIKPHTGFVGPIESGLMKMMLIGLGKHRGAALYHRVIQNYSFDQIVRSVGREVLQRCRILAGVAIVENQYDKTAMIEAVLPSEFETREPELLVEAKRLIPQLPFPSTDLLIVDEIGKNISGTGMDTNVVGRKYHDHQAREDEYPKAKRILVRDLTDETHGNATGIGIAEFCHSRVVERMNMKATRINCLTGGHPTAAMCPLDYPSDREMINAAMPTIGFVEPENAKVLWIRNTLDVGELECSEAFCEDAQARDDLEIIAEPREIEFNDQDDLPRVHTLSPSA